MSTYVTPAEYREALASAFGSRDPNAIRTAIEQASSRRCPGLLEADSSCYHLPLPVAWFLYGNEPLKHFEEIRAALGRPGDGEFWDGMRLLGIAACRAGDWRLLGRLSYVLDSALAVGADRQEPDSPAAQLCRAWVANFDVAGGQLTASSYLEAALAYFASLPAECVVPADLAGLTGDESGSSSADSKTDWPMLRLFWNNHHGIWTTDARSIDSLAAFPNPFLSFLAEQLRAAKAIAPRPPEKSPGRRDEPLLRMAREQEDDLPSHEWDRKYDGDTPPPMTRKAFPPPRRSRQRNWWQRVLSYLLPRWL